MYECCLETPLIYVKQNNTNTLILCVFVPPVGEPVLVSDKAYATPVEAKHSTAVGGSALTLCGLELVFVIVLDADHILRFLAKTSCGRKLLKRTNTTTSVKSLKFKRQQGKKHRQFSRVQTV